MNVDMVFLAVLQCGIGLWLWLWTASALRRLRLRSKFWRLALAAIAGSVLLNGAYLGLSFSLLEPLGNLIIQYGAWAVGEQTLLLAFAISGMIAAILTGTVVRGDKGWLAWLAKWLLKLPAER